MKQLLFSVALICAFFVSTNAQESIKAIRIDTPPVIDGRVNDPVWEQAFVTNEFYQREPNEGEPISEKTEFLTCYDANNIYFAVRCWSDPKDIIAKELARDVSLGNDDRIQIL